MRQVMLFIINGIVKTIDLTKEFILDKVGGLNITYYHFIIATILLTITVYLVNYIKDIIEVERSEEEYLNRWYEIDDAKKEYRAYRNWLWRNTRENKRR